MADFEEKKLIIADEISERLDAYLSTELNIPRSRIKKMIEANEVQVNGRACKGKAILKPGDEVRVKLVTLPIKLSPVKMPLDIVYEDENLIVINKPAGLAVHPAKFNSEKETLVQGVLAHCGKLSQLYHASDPLRDGVVHRLDRDTTGLIVFAKDERTHDGLAQQFKNKTNTRKYKALLNGVLPREELTIESYLYRDPDNRLMYKSMGKNEFAHIARDDSDEKLKSYRYSKTLIKVADVFWDRLSYVTVQLLTGRTHQIRIHCRELKAPVVGDLQYGTPCQLPKTFPEKLIVELRRQNSQLLHAFLLGFEHPITKAWLEFEVELPHNFAEILNTLKKQMNTNR